MVEPHVAGAAGFGTPGFGRREKVPGVAGIAFPLVSPDAMTAPTTFFPADNRLRLPGSVRHGHHRYPGQSMFPGGELANLLGVTQPTVLGRDQPTDPFILAGRGCAPNLLRGVGNRQVTEVTTYATLGMAASQPIPQGSQSYLALRVAIYAGLVGFLGYFHLSGLLLSPSDRIPEQH